MSTFFQQTAQAETFAKFLFPDNRNPNTGFRLSWEGLFAKVSAYYYEAV